MKSWYLTTQGSRAVNHSGQDIPVGKKIYLNEQQALMHGDSVVATSDPIGEEAAVEFDLREWQQALSGSAPLSTPTNTITVLNLNLVAETWTDLANSLAYTNFTVRNSVGDNLTDSFEYRRSNQGKWQIFSLISLNNLEIILYG